MTIYLHIGPGHLSAGRLQSVLAEKRNALRAQGVYFPTAPGPANHTRLFMAVTDPDNVDQLRHYRGFASPARQAELRDTLVRKLKVEIAQHQPEHLILSAHQFGSQLARPSELQRLRAFLHEFSDDIRIIAHVEPQARALVSQFAQQILNGRVAPLSREIGMAASHSWWQSALDSARASTPEQGCFAEVQNAPFWLDYEALQRHWEHVFGQGTLTFRPYVPHQFWGPQLTDELRHCFDLEHQIGKASDASMPALPSAPWLTRAREFNALLLDLLAQGKHVVPRKLWRQMLQDIHVEGPALSEAGLQQITDCFAASNARLVANHPALTNDGLTIAPSSPEWHESPPLQGFRASQYLLAFMNRIETATKDHQRAQTMAAKTAEAEQLSDRARDLLPPSAHANFAMLQRSALKPHNQIGALDESKAQAPYTEVPHRQLPAGESGTVVVGCMKNEAPYILEWVAYHRMIGVDNFLIYTNDCSDGTAEILDRLQELGVLQHRNNDNWRGKSPQQHALNQSIKEPLLRNATWIAHIDVDEFINVRCGNGRLDDFFARAPDATNVAMTWRMFGSNGITEITDAPVLAQFDHCAPRYCPKPHTVWGFKTLFRNIGAYEKISCHRPNKLAEPLREQVKWVNGSGRDMTGEAIDNGWRNSRRSIGYDLLQLNHYALRSAESYLVKRQRGRALHVDRSIGLNYWIRMDWNDVQDITIQRNLPRLNAERDRLLQDDKLRALHHAGLAWHQDKAAELHRIEEFETLYKQALEMKLSATERVAYTLVLDLES